jgi:hypothetical protein
MTRVPRVAALSCLLSLHAGCVIDDQPRGERPEAMDGGDTLSGPRQLAPALAFEDANDNGVFDGSDRDITERLRAEWVFATEHSVVITEGVLAIPDPKFKQTGAVGGVHITAGRDITVDGSILAPFYAGDVYLSADRDVSIGDAVTLNGRNSVNVYADRDIAIGDNVKLISRGGSANFGSATVYALGDVQAGATLQVSTLSDAFVLATSGSIAIGPDSRFISPRGIVSLNAGTDIAADGVDIKANSLVSIDAGAGSDDVITLRGSSLSVATVASRGGSMSVSAYNGTVDVTGAKFVRVEPQITAASVLQ